MSLDATRSSLYEKWHEPAKSAQEAFCHQLRPLLILTAVALLLIFSVVPSRSLYARMVAPDDAVVNCVEGTQLFLEGHDSDALPLLRAGFDNRGEAVFGNPDDLGRCALALGELLHDMDDRVGALEAYTVAIETFQDTGNRRFEGLALNGIGGVYCAQERYDDALTAFHRSLEIAREGSNRADEAAVLNNIGQVYFEQGHPDDALAAFREASSIGQGAVDAIDEAGMLYNIGRVYYDQEQYEEALDFLRQALGLVRQTANPEAEGVILGELGNVYYAQEDYAAALEVFQQRLFIRREAGDLTGEGHTLDDIGQAYEALGQYTKASEAYQQALSIWNKTDDMIQAGLTLILLGETYDALGRYTDALDAYQQALANAGEVGDRQTEAKALAGIAFQYEHQGRDDDALAVFQQLLTGLDESFVSSRAILLQAVCAIQDRQGHYEEALDSCQQALTLRQGTHDRAGEGEVLQLIAGICYEQGRYGDALRGYQRALAIHQEVGGEKAEMETLAKIGLVYERQGRDREAVEIWQQALDIARSVDDRQVEGAMLGNIAALYYMSGKFMEGQEYFEQSLNIANQAGDKVGVATILSNVGLMQFYQGQLPEALNTYQFALEFLPDEESQETKGVLLERIGSVYREQGLHAQAQEVYEQALAIRRDSRDQYGEGITLQDIGITYQEQGDLSRALLYYEEAMGIFDLLRSLAGSEAEQSAFIDPHAVLYDLAVGLYHDQGQDARAFYTSERIRARAFLDSLAAGSVSLNDQEDTDLLVRERESYSAREAANEALVRARASEPADLQHLAGLEANLAQAEESYNLVLQAIEARGGQLADLVPGKSTVLEVPDVQALIGDQTTLVSYHVRGSDEGALAFVVTNADFRVIELPEATRANLAKAINDLYTWPNLEDPYPLPLQNLYTWLIAPLTPHLSTPLIGIIPHWALHLVPFAALTDGETYFGEQHTLFSLPSASVLPFIRANAGEVASTGALILGNPKTEDLTLQPLVYAEGEARAVADLLGVPAYVGTEASEARLVSYATGKRVVHLASHVSLNEANPLHSAILLSASDKSTDSGDGRLETHEIYGLDLTATDLIILSSCKSYVGNVSAGDEIIGFTRALFFAGAPTVVSSQWAVDDTVTKEVMISFYQHWQAGMSKAEALQAAQTEVRAAHPSPFFWAAFVLSGDPGKQTSRPSSTEASIMSTGTGQNGRQGGQWLLVSVATPLLLLGLWVAYRRRKAR